MPTVTLGSGNDVYWGKEGSHTIYGNGGNDTLDGGAGTDIVYGGPGNDVLYPGDDLDYDQLFGGSGNDTYIINGFTNNDYVTETPGGGVDTVVSKGSYKLPEYVENLTLQDKWAPQPGASSMTAEGNDQANIITGSVFSDWLWGDGGNDRLEGRTGNDWLTGDAGNDTLNGGAGNDSLYGGTGNDTLNGGTGQDTLHGGDGVDALTGGGGKDSFEFYSSDTGDYTASKADTILDFTADDTIRLWGSYTYTANDPTPNDGQYSVWKNGANWMVTWNSPWDSGYHDIVVVGADPTGHILVS